MNLNPFGRKGKKKEEEFAENTTAPEEIDTYDPSFRFDLTDTRALKPVQTSFGFEILNPMEKAVNIPSNTFAKFDTFMKFRIPEGYYAVVSSPKEKDVCVVYDQTLETGEHELEVVVHNLSNRIIEFNRGEVIANVLISKTEPIEVTFKENK